MSKLNIQYCDICGNQLFPPKLRRAPYLFCDSTTTDLKIVIDLCHECFNFMFNSINKIIDQERKRKNYKPFYLRNNS